MASNSAAEAPSAATRQARFEQGVALSLNLWPALTLSVQNNWGGPDSADKRDWFAGQVVEQFPDLSSASDNSSAPTNGTQKRDEQADGEPDVEYVEELLLQVMLDEFEVNVDDDSAFDVATEIIRLRGQCARGNFEDVDRLLARWQGRKGVKVEGQFTRAQDQDEDTDWDDTDGDDDGDDDDDDMEEAPPLVEAPKKEKAAPEVDDDGFTKVTRKR
ncbi:rRNA accumulation-related protein [Cytospora paraplurivora]|uniref:rRNA accumulation-related protein n=1 Tax=Cytospora paraplurivora TaxID=2898453 RepID=A0AAN9YEI9_9PEZI